MDEPDLTILPPYGGHPGLCLIYGAYMTEIFRAGIQSVGHGQGEAADALGMTYWQTMRRVVLPQATRVIIPPTGNEFIAMMKDTALVASSAAARFGGPPSDGPSWLAEGGLQEPRVPARGCGLYWVLTAIFTFFQRSSRRGSAGYVVA